MRKRATVELLSVLAAVGDPTATDEVDQRVLDATEALLRTSGLRRWSVDDVADRAGVGRTSVYRRFGSREDLVHAVLARELRATLARIEHAAAAAPDLETKAVIAVSTGLAAIEGSVVDALLQNDPLTVLPFLTLDAGPLVALAREAVIAQVAQVAPPPPPELAEAAARAGLSFVLTRDTILPVGDPQALEDAVRRVVQPFLALLGVPGSEPG